MEEEEIMERFFMRFYYGTAPYSGVMHGTALNHCNTSAQIIRSSNATEYSVIKISVVGVTLHSHFRVTLLGVGVLAQCESGQKCHN